MIIVFEVVDVWLPSDGARRSPHMDAVRLILSLENICLVLG